MLKNILLNKMYSNKKAHNRIRKRTQTFRKNNPWTFRKSGPYTKIHCMS